MKKQVFAQDGEFWFTSSYVAKLLGTTRQKVETMAVRGLVRSTRHSDGTFLIAEKDVTGLRRDARALADLKKETAVARCSTQSDSMPKGTFYVGDVISRELRVKGRVGNPLKDVPPH